MISTFKDWKAGLNKGFGEDFKERLDWQQISIGKLLEMNFIKASIQLADNNDYIKVDTVSQDIDLFFGADFKLTFKDERDPIINNLSLHVDITANPEKKNMEILYEDIFTMSNGIKVSLGVKRENRFFYYSKPVMVIFLKINENERLYPIFKHNDIIGIFFAAKTVGKYISYDMEYEFAGEMKVGAGKRASEIVQVKRGKKAKLNKDNDFR